MSYFEARLGPPPEPETNLNKKIVADQKPSKPIVRQKSHFAAQVGGRPAEPGRAIPATQPATQPLTNQPVFHQSTSAPVSPSTCPLCGGNLLKKEGLYHCQGRCGASWLEESAGRLLDLAALPFGICGCCRQPQALVRGERGAVCPRSGEEYLLLAGGPTPRVEAAPYGLCLCCQPAMPLIQQDEGLVCQAKPYHHYQRRDRQPILIAPSAPTPSQAEMLAAIDDALRRNSARLTINGLFDFD